VSGEHPDPSENAEHYYGAALLKPPVWTWEVPAYFFVGGAAGTAALIGAVARRAGASDALVRDARWIAAAGAALSPPLLISDLGRPERFLNMLRVFKLRSPMSVGAWTLVAFSNAAAASAFADLAGRVTNGKLRVRFVEDASDFLAASTGLVLSTYTGVLLGATAIPVWSLNARLLPVHFGVSGLGSAVSLLEILGHRDRSLNALGIGAALVESGMAARIELSRDPAMGPIRSGHAGALARAAGVLSGPLPLLLRVLCGRSGTARRVAAVSTIAGSILTRAAWMAAGRATAPGQAIATNSRRTGASAR
jgi:formate-dependent nitrite reductase membrane component NrfD